MPPTSWGVCIHMYAHVPVYVCICVPVLYVFVYNHVYTHVYIYTHMYIFICVCMCVCVCVFTHERYVLCSCVCTCGFFNFVVCVIWYTRRVAPHKRTHVYKHIHVCIHTAALGRTQRPCYRPPKVFFSNSLEHKTSHTPKAPFQCKRHIFLSHMRNATSGLQGSIQLCASVKELGEKRAVNTEKRGNPRQRKKARMKQLQAAAGVV
jgi:hypothetical protein